MKRKLLNLAALAMVFAGAGHLHAEPDAETKTLKCCQATFGALCCGTTCEAGWFSCDATGG